MEEVNLQKQEEMKANIVEFYNKVKVNLYDEETIESIQYIDEMVLNEGLNMQYAESVYIVTKKVEEREIKEVYDSNRNLIATLNEMGELDFKEEYIELLKQKMQQLYGEFDFTNKKDFKMLLEKSKKNEKAFLQKDEIEEKEKEEEAKEECNEEELEKKIGLPKNSIKSATKIDPTQKITDDKTLQDIVPTTKEYIKIHIVAVKGKEDNARFHFIGEKEDGTMEEIEGLENREGVKTNNSIYCINEDAIVKEQEVTSLFNIGTTREEGLSVSIEQYGEVRVQYLRRSRTENKYIGKYLKTETQKPSLNQISAKEKEIRNLMDERKNPYVEDEIERAEKRTKESINGETSIENIDEDKNNDKIEDMDKEIMLPDETVTTMKKEAEKLKVSIRGYKDYYDKIEDRITDGEKILEIREMLDKERIR